MRSKNVEIKGKVLDDLFIELDDEYKETDNFIEFAIKAYKEYGFTVLYICEKAKFDFKKFYASFSKSWNYLPNYAGEAVELSPLTKLREKRKKEEQGEE